MKPTAKLKSNRSLLIILVALVLLMAALNPSRFFAVGNVISMAYQIPIIAFLSLGIMVSMLTGGINLAIISTTNFTGIFTVTNGTGTVTNYLDAGAVTNFRSAFYRVRLAP